MCDLDNKESMPFVPWGGGPGIPNGADVFGHYDSNINKCVIWIARQACQLCAGEAGQEFLTRLYDSSIDWTPWPSGLRRWLKAQVRKGVGSNPTGVIAKHLEPGSCRCVTIAQNQPSATKARGTLRGTLALYSCTYALSCFSLLRSPTKCTGV